MLHSHINHGNHDREGKVHYFFNFFDLTFAKHDTRLANCELSAAISNLARSSHSLDGYVPLYLRIGNVVLLIHSSDVSGLMHLDLKLLDLGVVLDAEIDLATHRILAIDLAPCVAIVTNYAFTAAL